ncbi:MAG: hypothetical protein L3J69_01745 [Desulfobacula sp.]|nr:hypothetical protein [Desulfobacula sp.]
MQMYAGIDLHSSNNYIGIIDKNDKRIFGKRLDNHLPTVLSTLAPFKKDLEAVVVESTFNWYWLVDGLRGPFTGQIKRRIQSIADHTRDRKNPGADYYA